MSFIYDIINLEFVLVILLLILSYLRLDIFKSSLIFIHLLVIFLLNDVLFEPNYWPDQIRYLKYTLQIRESAYNTIGVFGDYGARIGFPSTIYAFSPLPFINSVQSLAMINFLLYLLSFVYLRKKRVSSNSVDFFFLLYPSFLLYSSLALRGTLVTLFMILSLYFLIVEGKRLIALIFLLLLAFIKIQNFLAIVQINSS